MRHQKRGRKLGRTASHRKALLRNLASSLIIHKRIRTTDAKAKELRSFVERLVTVARKGGLHAHRQIQKALPGSHGQFVAQILFHDIAPHYVDRPGGYTRTVKLGPRSNDRALVSLVEFVDLPGLPAPEGAGKTAEKGKG